MTDDFHISPEVKKELEKVNHVWNDLIQNIHKKSNEERIKAILVQVMIEYYIDRILIISKVNEPKKIYKTRYDEKLGKLKELNLINDDLEYDLLRIDKIRNNYAHEIEVDEKRILDLINGVKTILKPKRFKENQRVDKVRNIILSQIQRTFGAVLETEQEKSENS